MENKTESMVSGYGYSDTACWMSLSHQIGEVRREVAETGCDLSKQIGEGNCSLEKSIGDAECDILSKVGSAECNINKNITDTAHRGTIHLNAVQQDLNNRIHENRSILTKEIGDKTEILRTQLNHFERSTSKELCDLKMEGFKNTQLVLTALSNNKLDEKNELIQKLLHKENCNHYSHQFALQNQSIDYLKQMINSLEYNQRATSVIKQNGVGNAAIPVMPVTQQ